MNTLFCSSLVDRLMVRKNLDISKCVRLLVLGVLSLHKCRREPWAHGWIKGSERAPSYKEFNTLLYFIQITFLILRFAVATAQVYTIK